MGRPGGAFHRRISRCDRRATADRQARAAAAAAMVWLTTGDTALTVLAPLSPIPPSAQGLHVARRPASSSRNSDRGKSGRSGAGRPGPRARTDGKLDVFCPQCSAQFRVAADALDQKIQCTECHRTFFAKTAVGKPRKQKDYTKTYVLFGVLTLFIVVTLALMSGGGSKPANAETPVVAKRTIDKNTHPRADRLKEWAQRVKQGDKFGIIDGTDMAAMLTQFGLPAADYANAQGAQKEALNDAILDAFKTNEAARYLRDLELTSASLETIEDAESSTGAGILYLSAPQGSKRYLWNRQCQIKVRFRADGAGNATKVTGWETLVKPMETDPTAGGAHHDKIAAPKQATSVDGRNATISESEPCALEHLASATPEMRAEIDKLIEELVNADPDAAGPPPLNRISAQLKRTGDRGREVVPRLLNKMYELYPDPIANNMKLVQVNAVMKDITGLDYAYDQRDSGDATKDKAKRQSTIRQWFAYWYSGFQKDWNIEKEESLERPKASEQQPAGTAPVKK